MPPRISSRRLAQPMPSQCFRTRPQSHYHPCPSVSSTRQFHNTHPQHTRLRRNMFGWLKGPGKAFRDPLAGSSNYLGAYDRQGQLLRARQNDEQEKRDESDLDEAEEAIQTRERESGVAEEEILERAEQRELRRVEKLEADQRDGIPRERQSDLRPYPLNRDFRSQPVLSEDLRKQIHYLVAERGVDLKSVSAAFGVDVRRVAAVVRLMEVEKEWVKEGKSLAKPYNKAVLAMLPQTPYYPNLSHPPHHEPINDLPVHPWTRQQIFVPASESREFTRADAAKAFHPSLLPADERIAHPELVQIAKWENEGHSRDKRLQLQQEADAERARVREEKERKKAEWERRTQVTVPGRRWDFRFQDVKVSAEVVGKDGKGRKAVGIRYGMPHEDRKKGQVKIPTKVE